MNVNSSKIIFQFLLACVLSSACSKVTRTYTYTYPEDKSDRTGYLAGEIDSKKIDELTVEVINELSTKTNFPTEIHSITLDTREVIPDYYFDLDVKSQRTKEATREFQYFDNMGLRYTGYLVLKYKFEVLHEEKSGERISESVTVIWDRSDVSDERAALALYNQKDQEIYRMPGKKPEPKRSNRYP